MFPNSIIWSLLSNRTIPRRVVVGVTVGVKVFVGVGVCPHVDVLVGVTVGVKVFVGVRVLVGVGVCPDVDVLVGVTVGVKVLVGVGVEFNLKKLAQTLTFLSILNVKSLVSIMKIKY